ncbi:hypothetical protein CHUAL_012247 [Chamberlinius hualienensis]
MAVVEGALSSLQEELEKAKENLKSVDENIKKLTGRVPFENRTGAQAVRRTAGGVPVRGTVRPNSFGLGARDADGPQAKRRTLTAFSRLEGRNHRRSREEDSADEDELPTKPTVQSSVVAHPKEQKTRKDCIEEQKPDAKGLARNRRMFGLLVGTLQKFQVEEKQKQHKEQKRVEIEKKLEDKVEREREDLKKERKELFLERKKRQAELRRLEYKMELAKQLEEWVQNRKSLTNFIATKATPILYYLPAKHNEVTQRLLDESKKKIEEDIKQLRETVEEEIENVGKRRAVAVDNELDIEGNGHDGQVRLGYDASGGEIGVDPNSEIHMNMEVQEDIMGEMYEESKGSFPMLIPMDQAPVITAEEGDTTVREIDQGTGEGVLPNTSENITVNEIVMSENSIIPIEVGELPVAANETNEEQEIDASELNKLAEKEFEPIYD